MTAARIFWERQVCTSVSRIKSGLNFAPNSTARPLPLACECDLLTPEEISGRSVAFFLVLACCVSPPPELNKNAARAQPCGSVVPGDVTIMLMAHSAPSWSHRPSNRHYRRQNLLSAFGDAVVGNVLDGFLDGSGKPDVGEVAGLLGTLPSNTHAAER